MQRFSHDITWNCTREKWLGLSGWLKSYLEMEYVNGCGVLQGSALGPLLVNVYMVLNVQLFLVGCSNRIIQSHDPKCCYHTDPWISDLDSHMLHDRLKKITCLSPKYISDLMMPYVPSGNIRSSWIGLLCFLRVRTKQDEAVFGFCSLQRWNKLIKYLRSAKSVTWITFSLKTSLFAAALQQEEWNSFTTTSAFQALYWRNMTWYMMNIMVCWNRNSFYFKRVCLFMYLSFNRKHLVNIYLVTTA